MKILIIEDNLPTLTLLGSLLEDHASVTACSDGEHGILEYKKALASKEAFEIIFLDVVLPGIQGDEVVRQIRELEKSTPKAPKAPKAPKVYIAIISGEVPFHGTGTGMYEGGDIYMAKPFVRSDILEVIEKVKPLAEEDLKEKP